MKKLFILLTIIVILPIFSVVCSAEGEVEDIISDFESILPREMGGLSDPEKLMQGADAKSLLSYLTSSLEEDSAELSSLFLTLVGAVALLSASSHCQEKLSEGVESVVGMICSLMIFRYIYPLIGMVSEGIAELSRFFGALIPIAVGITSLGGGGATASAQAVGMYTALSAVGGVGVRIFLFLAAFGLAMSLISSLGKGEILSVCRGLKGIFGWVSGIFTALITAAFSLQTLVASSVDSASMRAIRYAASGLIPVVGSTVSGAISTLASGMSYAKGIVGGGAITAMLYIAISPLVLLLLYRFAITVGILLSDFAGSATASRIFTSYRLALDMTVTVYSLSALIYLFEIIIFIIIGVAAYE